MISLTVNSYDWMKNIEVHERKCKEGYFDNSMYRYICLQCHLDLSVSGKQSTISGNRGLNKLIRTFNLNPLAHHVRLDSIFSDGREVTPLEHAARQCDEQVALAPHKSTALAVERCAIAIRSLPEWTPYKPKSCLEISEFSKIWSVSYWKPGNPIYEFYRKSGDFDNFKLKTKVKRFP